jgi:hypothetical protein
MANTILLKSRQADATGPGATALKVGELAVNTFDGRVYLGTDLSGSASRAAGGAATASTIVGAPVLDEDDMSSDSNKSLATQQSIKKYVDDEITANAGTGDITGVTLSGDSGSAADTSANVDLTIAGGSGITTSATSTTVTIAGDDASTSAKGVAQFSSDNFAASSGTITIKDGGVANAELAGSIADSKLNAISTANKVALSALDIDGGTDIGAAIASGDLIIVDDGAGGTNRKSTVDRVATLFAGDGLTASSAVMAVNVDDSSIETNSDAIRVKASGVTNAMLAGSIANGKLANSAITVGGTSTSLGGTVTGAHIAAALNSDLGGNFTIGNQSDDTCTITGNLTVSGTTTTVQNVAVGVSDTIIFEGSGSDDDHETTLTVVNPTADRTISLPNVTGTVITTGDTGTVTATMLAADSVDSSELVDGSIDTAHIANSQVTTAKIAGDAITEALIADDAVESEHLNDNVISGQSDIGEAIAATDEILISNGGTLAKSDVSRLGTFLAGDGLAVSSGVLAVGVDDSSIETNSDALRVKASGVTNAMLAGSIADSKLSTISTAGKVDIGALEIDGATDIGEGLADADLFIVDDGANGTERKCAASRIPTYVAAATMTLTNTTISGGAYST